MLHTVRALDGTEDAHEECAACYGAHVAVLHDWIATGAEPDWHMQYAHAAEDPPATET